MQEASALLDCFNDLTSFEKELILEKMKKADYEPSPPIVQPVNLKTEISKINAKIGLIIRDKKREEDNLLRKAKLKEDEK